MHTSSVPTALSFFSFCALDRTEGQRRRRAVPLFSVNSARIHSVLGGDFAQLEKLPFFRAVSQSPKRLCSSHSAKCLRREALAGLAFRWPRFSTQPHKPGDDEDEAGISFPPGNVLLCETSIRLFALCKAARCVVVLGSEKKAAESTASCRRCAGCKGKQTTP